jgi:hypothetical protein
MTQCLVPSFYTRRHRIVLHKIKWYHCYRFINKIKASKYNLLFNRAAQQNNKRIIFHKEKSKLESFDKQSLSTHI